MSLSVLSAQTVGALVTSGDGGSFEAPSVGDFFWPVIGGDSNWTLTRPAVVLLISVAILGWFYMTVAGRLSLVPSKRQWVAEQGYDFVRNTIARDIIGAKDFKPFLPMLFTIFTMILFNNLMGIFPFVQYPTMSRIGDRLHHVPRGRAQA